jgi:hypothetical protein
MGDKICEYCMQGDKADVPSSYETLKKLDANFTYPGENNLRKTH